MLAQIEQKAARAKGSVLQPNPRYRTAIGGLGLALPFAVALWPWPKFEILQSSISAYYYTGARDWFVGTLWVLALFLFFYQYEPQTKTRATSRIRAIRTGGLDGLLGMAAGVSAFLAAMVPTEAPCPNDLPEPCPGTQDLIRGPIIGKAHGIFAALLFVALALFPLLLFSQTSNAKRARMYRLCGGVMLFLLGLLAVYAWCFPDAWRDGLAPYRPVYWAEAILVCVFAFTWFQKGKDVSGRGAHAAASSAPGAAAQG